MKKIGYGTDNLIAHLVNVINQGYRLNKVCVSLKGNSNFCYKFLDILVKIQVISAYDIISMKRSCNSLEKYSSINIYLKYICGRSIVKQISYISKPKARLYLSSRDLYLWANKVSISATVIVSTTYGFMVLEDVLELQLGGEVICFIYF